MGNAKGFLCRQTRLQTYQLAAVVQSNLELVFDAAQHANPGVDEPELHETPFGFHVFSLCMAFAVCSEISLGFSGGVFPERRVSATTQTAIADRISLMDVSAFLNHNIQ